MLIKVMQVLIAKILNSFNPELQPEDSEYAM